MWTRGKGGVMLDWAVFQVGRLKEGKEVSKALS